MSLTSKQRREKRRRELIASQREAINPHLTQLVNNLKDGGLKFQQIKNILLDELKEHFNEDEMTVKRTKRTNGTITERYQHLVNNHKMIVDTMKKKIKVSMSPNGMGCINSNRTVNASRRPHVHFTVSHLREIDTNSKGLTFGEQILQTHIVMLSEGVTPSTDTDEASHLCHNNHCVNPDHLVWESPNRNRLRGSCEDKNECGCGLDPKCIFPEDP